MASWEYAPVPCRERWDHWLHFDTRLTSFGYHTERTQTVEWCHMSLAGDSFQGRDQSGRTLALIRISLELEDGPIHSAFCSGMWKR